MSAKKGKRATFLTDQAEDLKLISPKNENTIDAITNLSDYEDQNFNENDEEYPNPFYQQYLSINERKTEKINNSLPVDNSNINDNREAEYSFDVECRNKVLSAIAPKIIQQDDTEIEVSSTPAFQCLEEVLI
jgi:hypothetical protein